MVFEIAGLVLRNKVVECSSEERQVSIVVICNRIGQSLVLKGHQMLKVDVEGGKIVDF